MIIKSALAIAAVCVPLAASAWNPADMPNRCLAEVRQLVDKWSGIPEANWEDQARLIANIGALLPPCFPNGFGEPPEPLRHG
jgi:hypothetical protein